MLGKYSVLPVLTLKLNCKYLAEEIYFMYLKQEQENTFKFYKEISPFQTVNIDDKDLQQGKMVKFVKTKVGFVQCKPFWNYMNKYRDYTSSLIKMVSHPDFVSYVDNDLQSLGCLPFEETSFLSYPITDEEYHRQNEIIINQERHKLNIHEKINILNYVINYIHNYYKKNNLEETYGIEEVIYNHYLRYKQLNDLFVTGFVVDNQNFIYGM
tara:strand:+ start:470 stop:1102 length:633 start_codon:yes stop_codon:yes gene_type:complete